MSQRTEALRKRTECKGCLCYKPIKTKDLCQNCWHKVKRKTQPEFFLRTRYTEMYQRCRNINNKCSDIYGGLDICTRSEFLDRFLTDQFFLKLFNEWIDSGWEQRLTPSIDRIDNVNGYTLDNMQFLTHSQNASKDQPSVPVDMYDVNGNLIRSFKRMRYAADDTKIPQANIWKVVNGERETAGGFVFCKAGSKPRLPSYRRRYRQYNNKEEGRETVRRRRKTEIVG